MIKPKLFYNNKSSYLSLDARLSEEFKNRSQDNDFAIIINKRDMFDIYRVRLLKFDKERLRINFEIVLKVSKLTNPKQFFVEDVFYYMEEIPCSKIRFLDFLKESYPDHFTWLLFNEFWSQDVTKT